MPRENYNVNWQISWVIGVHEVLMPFLIQSWQQDINLGCCLAHCHPVSARNLKSSLLPSISLLSSAPKRTLPQLPSAPLSVHTQLSPLPNMFPFTWNICFCCSFALICVHPPALSKGILGPCCGRNFKHVEAKYPLWAGADWHNNAVTLFDKYPAKISKIHFSGKRCTFRSCPVSWEVTALCLWNANS